MHISKFIEQQKLLNPEPNYWWQRESAVYIPAIMIAMAIFGMWLAQYMVFKLTTVKIMNSPELNILLCLLAFVGLLFFATGVVVAKLTIETPEKIKHQTAILIFVLGAVVVTPLAFFLNTLESENAKIMEERQVLQSAISSRKTDSQNITYH